jgi:sugar phosphate isomerase/epimerase
MKSYHSLSRRDFLVRMTAAASAIPLSTASSTFGATQSGARSKIIGFSKPFQKLTFDETADVVAQVGWDGIECPVRQRGQILPERVEEDLPKLVQALRKRNVELQIAVTDIRNTKNPLNEKVLRTASKLGIKLYRLAHIAYDRTKPLPAQLNEIRAELRDLHALNKELGLCALYENHSGADSVGAAIWDMYELLKDFDPKCFGICFDVGHATIEGGMAWPTNFRLIQPLLRSVYVKDFVWKKTGASWKAEWCPLGEGMVNKSFIQMLKKSSFDGPIVQHHEYPVGAGAEMVNLMKKDLATLKDWLATV